MKVQTLGIEEMARYGATHRVIVGVDDINGTGTGFGALSAASAAATSATLKPFTTLAAGQMAAFLFGYLKTNFDGTSSTALTLQVGYDLATGTDKAAGYLAAVSIHNDNTPISYFPQELADVDSSSVDQTYGTQESAALTSAIAALNSLIKSTRKVFGVANDLGLLFTSTTANLTDLLTGEVHLYFRVNDLNKA